MKTKNSNAGLIAGALLLSVLGVMYCGSLPTDPNALSNTSVSPILRASDWTQNRSEISDTVGNTVQIGVLVKLPQHVDSIKMSIAAEGVAVCDTVFTMFRSEITDTLWKKMYFSRPGTKTVNITPYSTKVALSPSIAIINIFNRPDQNNVKPELSIPARVTVEPAAVCSIQVRVVDSDLDQSHTVTMSHFPAGAVVQGDSLFLWSVPGEFSGIDSVVFIAIDNGMTPLADTATTILGFSGTETQKPVIRVTGNYSIHPLETCSLTVSVTGVDSGKTSAITINGHPDGARLIDEKLFVWTAPSDAAGSYPVTFSVLDNSIPAKSDSEVVTIEVVPVGVERAPVWSTDTLPVLIADDSSFSLLLSDSCSDPDGDDMVYTLIDGSPTGDTIIDGRYSVSANAGLTGMHFVRIVATDPVGLADTITIKLTVSSTSSDTLSSKPEIVRQPGDTAVVTGSPLAFSLTVAGTNLHYEWRKDDVPLSSQPDSEVLSYSAVSSVNSGTYTVKVWNMAGSIISNPVRLRVLPKTPAEPVLEVLSATVIKVTWASVTDASWYRVVRSLGTGAFAGICSVTTNGTLDESALEGKTYRYRVIAGNSDGISDTSGITSATTFEGPEITTHPEPTSQTVVVGNSCRFSVTATGNPACTYQWQKDGAAITGATAASYTLMVNELADSGNYRCVVTNSVRSVNSNSARVIVQPVYTLTTITLPTAGGSIAKDPDAASYVSGTGVTLTVTANSGYRFTGWSGDLTSATSPVSLSMTKAMTVTANFVRVYTLNVTSANTSQGTVTPATSVVLSSGETRNIIATAISGYRFANWSTTAAGVEFGSSTTANTTVKLTSGNATVTANWEVIPFTVTYYANGGTGTVPVDPRSYYTGDAATVLPNTGMLMKGDSSFNGWNTKANGSGSDKACGGSVTMTSSVSLYAKYSSDYVMDNDGNTYYTTTIGGKKWMARNLMTTKYNNGDPITFIEGEDAWKNLVDAAYCWPENSVVNKENYGALYNWYAVITGNLAPAGWHVATLNDWSDLWDTVSSKGEIPCKLIDKWSTCWTNPPDCGDNWYAFSANGNGCRECQGTFGLFSDLTATYGFVGIKNGAAWWTSTAYGFADPATSAYFFSLTPTIASPNWWFTGFVSGMGVRCVKNE